MLLLIGYFFFTFSFFFFCRPALARKSAPRSTQSMALSHSLCVLLVCSLYVASSSSLHFSHDIINNMTAKDIIYDVMGYQGSRCSLMFGRGFHVEVRQNLQRLRFAWQHLYGHPSAWNSAMDSDDHTLASLCSLRGRQWQSCW